MIILIGGEKGGTGKNHTRDEPSGAPRTVRR